jgi:ribosomal protein S6--L-glutamate ligase
MRIAILSGDRALYSTKRLHETAVMRGHTVAVINPAHCFLQIESWKNNSNTCASSSEGGTPSSTEGGCTVLHRGQPLEDYDVVIPRIGASLTFYGAAILRQLEMLGVRTTLQARSLEQARDKLKSLQILAAAGIDFPRTAFAFRPIEIDDLIERVGGPPVILKLIEGTQGIGVVLAETKAAARSVIDSLHALHARFLAQEFIEESQGADIRAFVIGNEVVAAMRRQSQAGEFRSNIHRGGTGEPVELSEAEKIIAIKASAALGLSIAGIDLLRSNRGPLVMEVNASPGLEGIETTTKIDVAGKIIEFIEKLPTLS